MGLFGEFWRVFAVTKGVFAVTKVVEGANVSLLALYKEGKSDPDPPPWTPLFTTRAPPRTLSPTRVTGDQTSDHCQVQQHGVPPFSDGQVPNRTLTPSLSLSSAARVQYRTLGFFSFVCVSACGPVFK